MLNLQEKRHDSELEWIYKEAGCQELNGSRKISWTEHKKNKNANTKLLLAPIPTSTPREGNKHIKYKQYFSKNKENIQLKGCAGAQEELRAHFQRQN